MFSKKCWMGVAVAVMVAALVGCNNSQKAEAEEGESVVVCSKCETVWVSRPSGLGSRTIVYRSAKEMHCADCEKIAQGAFKSGTLDHQCTHCGGALIHCKHKK